MNFEHNNEHDAPKQSDAPHAPAEPPTPPAHAFYSPPAPMAAQATTPDISPVHTPPHPAPHQPVNAGLVVLQWLTYAFWGWTVFGLSILTSTVLASFINDADVGGFTPYGIAAVLVLLPISYICDVFYSKREPAHKTGAETLVMVIHTVLFALFGIGSLIFAVFSLVQLLTASTGTDYAVTTLVSSLIIAVYYGLTFLRTLNPVKASWIKRFYKLFMLITVGVIIVLGIVGPVAKERTLRDDKLIETELTGVQEGVQTYASANKKLPENLHAITVSGDTKKLVDRNIVTYKPNTKEPTVPASSDPVELLYKNIGSKAAKTNSASQTTVYHYQLCVTFKKASNSDHESYKSPSTNEGDDGYSNYLSVYDHPAGNICYKLDTENY